MNWHATSHEDRITWLIECCENKMPWRDIRKAAGVSTNTVTAYRKYLPAELRPQKRQPKHHRDDTRCPSCGWDVDEPGECYLCQAQRQGRIVLYTELEAMHG